MAISCNCTVEDLSALFFYYTLKVLDILQAANHVAFSLLIKIASLRVRIAELDQCLEASLLV